MVEMPHVEIGDREQLAMPDLLGVTHRYVEARGTTFHVAEAGSGPPLLLLHGWPQHWWSWRAVIGPLAERYHVLCPDVRGLGWSRGAEGSYRWDSLADDVVGLMDALDIDRARLVGHDWGLVAGYRACLLHPERFSRFAALAGIHPWQGVQTSPALIAGVRHLWTIALVGAAGVERLGLAEWALRTWRFNGAYTEAEAATYLGPIRRPSSVAATVKFDRATAFFESRRLLRDAPSWRLRVPTLHLLGEHDPLTPRVPRNFGPYADDLTMRSLPGCGHFIAEERPVELLQHLEPFLWNA